MVVLRGNVVCLQKAGKEQNLLAVLYRDPSGAEAAGAARSRRAPGAQAHPAAGGAPSVSRVRKYEGGMSASGEKGRLPKEASLALTVP